MADRAYGCRGFTYPNFGLNDGAQRKPVRRSPFDPQFCIDESTDIIQRLLGGYPTAAPTNYGYSSCESRRRPSNPCFDVPQLTQDLGQLFTFGKPSCQPPPPPPIKVVCQATPPAHPVSVDDDKDPNDSEYSSDDDDDEEDKKSDPKVVQPSPEPRANNLMKNDRGMAMAATKVAPKPSSSLNNMNKTATATAARGKGPVRNRVSSNRVQTRP